MTIPSTTSIASILTKATSWMQILKALPYDGGPSTTKWVYLRVAEVVSLCELMFALATAVVYWRTGHLDTSMMGLHLGIITALFGFASNTKNQQQALNAQMLTGTPPTSTSSTPLNSESGSAAVSNG